MASHHSAKLGADRHLSSGDMMSLVVEGHMPSFRSVIIGYLTQQISGRRHNNLPVFPMKDSLSWKHMSARGTDRNYTKNLC